MLPNWSLIAHRFNELKTRTQFIRNVSHLKVKLFLEGELSYQLNRLVEIVIEIKADLRRNIFIAFVDRAG